VGLVLGVRVCVSLSVCVSHCVNCSIKDIKDKKKRITCLPNDLGLMLKLKLK